MLFAHGFGCDQNMWRFVTPAFEDDYRIVLFDYVGSGKSDLGAYDAKRYSILDGYADDILDICHALHLEEVILVGHSVSSMVGVLAAVGRGEIPASKATQFLDAEQRSGAKGTAAALAAPAAGLFLEYVRYKGDPPVGPLRPMIVVSE